jgi:hypothetical protein
MHCKLFCSLCNLIAYIFTKGNFIKKKPHGGNNPLYFKARKVRQAENWQLQHLCFDKMEKHHIIFGCFLNQLKPLDRTEWAIFLIYR